MRRGRSTGAAISEGYKKGFSTIVDANVVTLLVAFILFILASASVRGFALTLGLGTIVSLFTAVLATQAILLSLRSTNLLKSESALGRPASASAGGSTSWARRSVLRDVRRHPPDRRARDRRQGPEVRHRLRVRHPDPRLARAVGDRRPGAAGEDDAGFGHSEVQTVNDPKIGKNVVQISTSQLEPPRSTRSRTPWTASSASPNASNSRSARRSASPSRTRRSSRSSPRCR